MIDPRIQNMIEKLQASFKLEEAQELIEDRYKGDGKPSCSGFCYTSSEVLYHALGGKKSGWTPMFIRHEEGPHWYLRAPDGTFVDPTSEQFSTPVPYAEGRGKGFMTRSPSLNARLLADIAGISIENPDTSDIDTCGVTK